GPRPKTGPAAPRPPAPPPARSGAPDLRQWNDTDVNAPPPRRYVNPPPPAPQESRAELPRRSRPGSSLPDTRQSDTIFDQPLPTEPPPSQRHPLRRSVADRRSISDSGRKDFRSVVSEANELGA